MANLLHMVMAIIANDIFAALYIVTFGLAEMGIFVVMFIWPTRDQELPCHMYNIRYQVLRPMVLCSQWSTLLWLAHNRFNIIQSHFIIIVRHTRNVVPSSF